MRDVRGIPSKPWLADIKAGDTVYRNGGYMTSYMKLTVDKVTPTQIVCGNGRFRRDSGAMIGDSSYSRAVLVEPTQAVLDRCRADEVIRELNGVMRDRKTTAALFIALGDALNRYREENPDMEPEA